MQNVECVTRGRLLSSVQAYAVFFQAWFLGAPTEETGHVVNDEQREEGQAEAHPDPGIPSPART